MEEHREGISHWYHDHGQFCGELLGIYCGLTDNVAQAFFLNLHDVSAAAKTAENLLELVLADILLASSTYGCEIIAWCSDAGGDSRAMRRRLYAKFPSLVQVDCWAHQV